jgi:hypothetical protein
VAIAARRDGEFGGIVRDPALRRRCIVARRRSHDAAAASSDSAVAAAMARGIGMGAELRWDGRAAVQHRPPRSRVAS